MVRLVVDDDDILVGGQFAQHTAGERLVRLPALLHDRAFLLLQRHESVPVLDQHFGLVQLLAQRLGRTQVELVVVAALAGQQDLQTFLHGQPRCHDEHHAAEVLVPLRIGQRVQHLPCDDHRHHRGLARPRRHLVAEAFPRPAVAGDCDALFERVRPFNPPDQCLDGLKLAEVEWVLTRITVVPVLQQLASDDGHAGPARLAPGVDAGADRVDQIQHLRPLGIVARVENLVARGPTRGSDLQLAALGLNPMLGGADEGRVDDEGHRISPPAA